MVCDGMEREDLVDRVYAVVEAVPARGVLEEGVLQVHVNPFAETNGHYHRQQQYLEFIHHQEYYIRGDKMIAEEFAPDRNHTGVLLFQELP